MIRKEEEVLYIHRPLIAVPFVLLPFFFGAIQPWHQAIAFSSFLVLLVCCLWTSSSIILPLKNSTNSTNSSNPTNPKNPINPSNSTNPITLTLIAFILIYPFLQAVHLPLSWLQAFSPERFFWLSNAGEVTGLEPAWTSISYTPLQTVFAGFRWIFIALFVLIFYRFLGEEKHIHWLIKLFFLIALGEAIYGLMQALVPSLHVLCSDEEAYRGCARGTFINRNHFACFLNLLWPLLLAYLLALSSKFQTGHSRDFFDPGKKEQLRHIQIFFGFLIGIVLLHSKRMELLIFVAGCWGIMLVLAHRLLSRAK